jgi:membrane protease YdiL (CAAX protease family)
MRASNCKDVATASVPAWHTAALIGVIVAVAVVGLALRLPAVPTGSRITHVYLPLVSVEIALAGYVTCVGVPRDAWRAWVGRLAFTRRTVFVDAVIAIAMVAAIVACEATFGEGRNVATDAQLPRTIAERWTWVLVAVSAGVGEELVYRGYLQTRFTALTGSTGWAITLQAVLFAIAHANQGVPALRFVCYGALFGVVRHARQSIVPGAVAHVAIDLGSGLLG